MSSPVLSINPALRVEGLVKVFGQFRALDQLNFSVEPGTVFGFLGPNGAGKTTTIRILTGLAHPTAGQAWVAGVDINRNNKEASRRIGYLPEVPAFYPWMTPGEFLDLVGRIFGLHPHDRTSRVKELLEIVDLAKANKRRIGGFSRGMRQRLGLAQALMNRPDVLFLDEPISALDPAGRKEVLELIEQLHGQCTVFMSTHILADVERVCNTIGIINQGRMIVTAPREALLEQYAIPAFEISVAPEHENQLASWINSLLDYRWVKSTAMNGPTARVVVNDMTTAQKELLLLAVKSGLPLTRYEVMRPSLEEVFLQLVDPENGKP